MSYSEALTKFNGVIALLTTDGLLKDSYLKQVSAIRSTLELMVKAETALQRKEAE